MDSLLAIFLQGSAIGISAALSPGPFQSLLIAQSLMGGWKRAAPIAFGSLIADIPIAIVLVFAVSQVPESFLLWVRYVGAALLIYLAWGVWKELQARKVAQTAESLPALSPWRALMQGVLMIFLSPGSYLFWALVLGPILVAGQKQSLAHGVLFLVGFYVFSIGGLLIIAWLLSRLGSFSPRWRRGLQISSLVLMLVIALLLFSGII
jgi:threonine/homoserine/homoserine lactone efflux protein